MNDSSKAFSIYSLLILAEHLIGLGLFFLSVPELIRYGLFETLKIGVLSICFGFP